jgi:hypothetical protein
LIGKIPILHFLVVGSDMSATSRGSSEIPISAAPEAIILEDTGFGMTEAQVRRLV